LAGLAAPQLEEFARHAVSLGGTVSAEHGLGKRKAGYLKLQYMAEEIEKMRAVKRRLDPGNILGRGTLWSWDQVRHSWNAAMNRPRQPLSDAHNRSAGHRCTHALRPFLPAGTPISCMGNPVKN
jgi:hypothetical protein